MASAKGQDMPTFLSRWDMDHGSFTRTVTVSLLWRNTLTNVRMCKHGPFVYNVHTASMGEMVMKQRKLQPTLNAYLVRTG